VGKGGKESQKNIFDKKKEEKKPFAASREAHCRKEGGRKTLCLCRGSKMTQEGEKTFDVRYELSVFWGERSHSWELLKVWLCQ